MSATLIDQPDAGQSAPAAPQAAGPRREARSMEWRLKHCAAPPAAVAAIACAGAVGQLGTQPAMVTTGTYFVAAVFLWIRAERKVGKAGRRARRRRLARKYRGVVSASGLVWLAWADATSVGGWRAVTLLVSGYALTSLGVLLFGSKIPNPAATQPEPEPAPAPATVVDSEATRLVHDWNRYIGGPKGRLTGAEIRSEDAIETETGAKAILRLVRGQQSIEAVRQTIPLIKTGLGYVDVTVEPHPGPDPALVMLTVVAQSRSATRDTIPWAGPALDLKTGLVDLGPYSDGDGVAYWRVLTENRMHGGLIIGDKDSGKSGLAKNIGLSCGASGLITVNVADPDDGASSPELFEWAHLAAGNLDRIRLLFRMLRAGLEFRQLENSVNKWEGFNPLTQNRKGILTVVHECHRAFADPQIREDAEYIDRHGGKVGMAVLAETQDATVEGFGDSDILRATLASSNYVATHTESYNNESRIPGLKGDPTTLPKLPGYAYSASGRAQMWRGRYVREEDGWTQRITNPTPDVGFINAMGETYSAWHAQLGQLADWQQARYDAIKEGRTPPAKPVFDLKATAVTLAVNAASTGADRMGVLLEMPAFVATGPRVTARDRVLQLLADGVVRTGALVDASGVTDTTVRKECGRLVDEGLAEQVERGHWRLTDAGYAEAAKAVAS